jgi:hypothetical protein
MLCKAWLQLHVSRLIRNTLGSGRLSYIHRLFFLCTVLILGSPKVWAQEPATSIDQLNLILGKGDKVALVDLSGDKIAGRVVRLGPNELDLNVNNTIRTFTENDIRQITRSRPDSPLNGFLIGAGTGFVLTLPLNLAFAGHDEKGVAVAASTIWGLIGGGMGALVDACVHGEQLVYFRPRTTVSWSISPASDMPARFAKPAIRAFPSDLSSNAEAKPSKGVLVTVRF